MKLLFDCDGTILDSMHIWTEPINRIFEKYNFSLESLTKEEKGEIEALPLGGMCDYIVENLATDMTSDEVREYFNEIIEEGYRSSLMPKDGALAKLEELYEAGFQMAIASSTDSMYLKLAFERLNIGKYFDFFTTPDLTNARKSDKEFWKYAIDEFGVSPSEIMLFDDALYAVKAANDAGIMTCGVKDFPYNENEWDDIVDNANFVMDTIADINIADL